MRKALIRKVFALAVLSAFVLAMSASPAPAMDEATQKGLAKAVFWIPGPGWIAGFGYSWYKAGEMKYVEDYCRAVRNNQPRPAGNETRRGLEYLFFKGLSTAPEGIAFYGVGQTFFLLKYDQLDSYSVWTAYGRPYLIDLTVIGAKAAGGAMGAYAGQVGLPILRPCTEPIQNAFVYMAMIGGSWNIITGTASQAFQGATPFQRYYNAHRWWSGNEPLK